MTQWDRGFWQVIQGPDPRRVLIVASAETPDASVVRAQIAAALSDRGIAVPGVAVEGVAAIPRAASGKAPLVNAYRAGSG